MSSSLKRRNSSYQKAKKPKINRKLPIIMILFQNFPTPISKFPRVAWDQRWIWQEKNPTLLLIFRNFPTPRVGFQSPTPRNPTRGVISNLLFFGQFFIKNVLKNWHFSHESRFLSPQLKIFYPNNFFLVKKCQFYHLVTYLCHHGLIKHFFDFPYWFQLSFHTVLSIKDKNLKFTGLYRTK